MAFCNKLLDDTTYGRLTKSLFAQLLNVKAQQSVKHWRVPYRSNMRVAVATGSNKGIGLAIVKGLCQRFEGTVYLTARTEELGLAAVAEVKKDFPSADLHFHRLDITDKTTIIALKNHLEKSHGGLDILINNAGVANEYGNQHVTASESEKIIRTNFFGTLDVCDVLFPILKPHARVVNVSSTLGMLRFLGDDELRKKYLDDNMTLAELQNLQEKRELGSDKIKMNTTFGAYAYSKIGVTKLGFIQQKQFDADPSVDLIVNSCCPGFVATALNSNKGILTTSEGAETPLYLALLPHNSPVKGKFVKKLVEADWTSEQ